MFSRDNQQNLFCTGSAYSLPQLEMGDGNEKRLQEMSAHIVLSDSLYHGWEVSGV